MLAERKHLSLACRGTQAAPIIAVLRRQVIDGLSSLVPQRFGSLFFSLPATPAQRTHGMLGAAPGHIVSLPNRSLACLLLSFKVHYTRYGCVHCPSNRHQVLRLSHELHHPNRQEARRRLVRLGSQGSQGRASAGVWHAFRETSESSSTHQRTVVCSVAAMRKLLRCEQLLSLFSLGADMRDGQHTDKVPIAAVAFPRPDLRFICFISVLLACCML